MILRGGVTLTTSGKKRSRRKKKKYVVLLLRLGHCYSTLFASEHHHLVLLSRVALCIGPLAGLYGKNKEQPARASSEAIAILSLRSIPFSHRLHAVVTVVRAFTYPLFVASATLFARLSCTFASLHSLRTAGCFYLFIFLHSVGEFRDAVILLF